MSVADNSLKNLRPRTAWSAERRAEIERSAKEMEASIEAMAGNGLSPQQIALLTGLKPDRLYRRYRGAMMKGGARRTNEVAESAYQMAVGGPEKNWRQADAGMAKFWLERLGGSTWAPRGRDEDDGPDLSRLTVAQLIELERALRPLARHPGLVIEGARSEPVISNNPRMDEKDNIPDMDQKDGL
jgi:hypothetical protein